MLFRSQGSESVFGFELDVFFGYLPFDQAKPFLKEDATPDRWESRPYSEEQLRKDMAAYMDFAWGKCLSHRGLSASRSVDKIGAWLWLLGDDNVLQEFRNAPYTNYGAPKLRVACLAYGLPMPEYAELQNMIQGLPCEPGCESGCGK